MGVVLQGIGQVINYWRGAVGEKEGMWGRGGE